MKASKWLWFAAFVVVWMEFCVFWLDGDAGIPSVWEYGYNVTDEGYYMGAAKDKFLSAAGSSIVPVKGRRYYVTERYDRKAVDGRVERFLQEDFCQAMGVRSEK